MITTGLVLKPRPKAVAATTACRDTITIAVVVLILWVGTKMLYG